MAIILNAADIHLTTALQNYGDRQDPCTVAGWVYGSFWNNTNLVYSLFGIYLTGVTGIQIGTRGSSRQLDFWIWGGSVYLSSTGYTPPNNTWIHVAYTYDGTTHHLYINGVLNNTSTYVPTAGMMNQIYINGYPTGGTQEVADARIDDILYFNRCLSAAEIQTIATGRGFRDGIYYGLFARYCFNELPPTSILTSVQDYSGHGNSLTPVGSIGANFTYTAGVIDLDDCPVLG